MKLEIENQEELNDWFHQCYVRGHNCTSIQGPPPEGATYYDGELIMFNVNVAWVDTTTDERIDIKYKENE